MTALASSPPRTQTSPRCRGGSCRWEARCRPASRSSWSSGSPPTCVPSPACTRGKPTAVEEVPPPPAPAPPSQPVNREPSPVPPERFALLQALLAFLLASCGDDARARVPSAEVRDRFRLTTSELTEHLDLLNLVNFGGGCYAVYCSTENGSIIIDKELYGDTFRRPGAALPAGSQGSAASA